MAEWLWRQAHTTSDRVENDPRTLAEVLRCLMCELSYNPDSNDVVGRETLLNRYSQLMSSRLSGEGVKDIADISQAANHQKNGEEGDWQSELNFEEFSARLAPSRDEMGSKAVEVPQLVRDRVAQFLRGDQAGQHPPNTGSSSHAVEDRSIPLSGGFHVPARMAAANPTQQFTTSLTHKNNDVGGAGNSEVDDQGQFPSFKSAREQLLLNNKKVAPTNSSGQPKKSLGPRRQTNKFTSPIVADQTPTARSEATWVADCAGVEDELPEELAHLDPATVKLIISEIMDTNASVSWNDIAGLQFAKKTLKEIIILPMLRPDIFTGLRGPPRGLLLFGPPGTGKTLIGKCVASQSKCTFFSISASSLTSKWVGEGEKMVRTLFAVARCKQPSVIFIDEIDSLLTQRSESEHESSRRIKTEFLVQMDGVTCGEEDRVLVIGATNRPQELDEAARRRFVKRLYIPLPESEARMTIVKGLMQRQSSQLSEGDLQAIVKQTEGYSGADMASLCKEAALGPVRDIHYEDIETITLDQVRPVVFADFNSALNQVRATVDSSDLHSYMSWNSKFGSWAIQHPQS